ncbi:MULTISPECIES: glycine cleavage system protein H [Bizionia]|uniref:Glycine cleavage system protein H n=1 Tax=Bizionia algoritergicola TaxID=291187 RepID=A0A5D0QVW1_9FLAO|nr:MULTISPECIES: glycine cleavage system protein H [Bizionia]OBX22119.1 glycine cleavage system protein H [Bizionia sp. APA-3]TYB72334.1 glycine cleavage system protein H [Bizionia algoritergicola]
MQVPKNVYYTKQHVWLQKVGRNDFCVGITDFGQKEIGEIDLIELNSKGSLLKKGAIWGVVYGINKTFQLIAPFDCQIIEKNRDLQKLTAYVNTAPYKYWFAILTAKTNTATLLNAQDYTLLTQ